MRVLTNQTAFSSGACPPHCLVAADVWLSQIKPDQRPGFLHPHPGAAINGDMPESVLGPKKADLFLPSSHETLGVPGKKKNAGRVEVSSEGFRRRKPPPSLCFLVVMLEI